MSPARLAACLCWLAVAGATVLAVPAAGEPKFPAKPSRQLSVSLVICFPSQAPGNCGPGKPHGKHLTGTPIPPQARHVGTIELHVPPSNKKAKMTCPGRCGGFLPLKTVVEISATATQDPSVGYYDYKIVCGSQEKKTCRFSLTRQTTINVVFYQPTDQPTVTARRRN